MSISIQPVGESAGFHEEESTSPAEGAFDVTPNDGADLAAETRAIYIGGAGDLHVTLSDGSEVTFVGLLVGAVYPLRVTRVFATDTTATNIIGLV